MNKKYLIDKESITGPVKKFLSSAQYAINKSGISWDTTKNELSLNPFASMPGSDGLGIVLDGAEVASINTAITQIKSDLSNVFFGTVYSVNPRAASTPSSAITPTQTFVPSNVKYMAILKFYTEIQKVLDEIDNEDYGRSVKYVHEVLDYDEFQASEGDVDV